MLVKVEFTPDCDKDIFEIFVLVYCMVVKLNLTSPIHFFLRLSLHLVSV